MRIVLALLFAMGMATVAGSQMGCEECNLPGTCCKKCKDSKPCGDSCIARNQTCHTIGGCACSAATP